MNKPITPSTYVRCLNVGLIRKLSDFIDPQEGWKKLAVAIKKPSGDDRYNQFHISKKALTRCSLSILDFPASRTMLFPKLLIHYLLKKL
uniref:Interleukin 1 receptor associated kinase 4 n=1 Tax=Homo sapiens TaxID=9606 RepID=A0A8Q3SIT8_HUMAN